MKRHSRPAPSNLRPKSESNKFPKCVNNLISRCEVERSHRIDEEEFYRLLEGVLIEDVDGFKHKLQEWENFYNYHRPHGALDGQSPYERLRDKAQLSD